MVSDSHGCSTFASRLDAASPKPALDLGRSTTLTPNGPLQRFLLLQRRWQSHKSPNIRDQITWTTRRLLTLLLLHAPRTICTASQTLEYGLRHHGKRPVSQLTSGNAISSGREVFNPTRAGKSNYRGMRSIKTALDPHWLTNAGKFFEYTDSGTVGDCMSIAASSLAKPRSWRRCKCPTSYSCIRRLTVLWKLSRWMALMYHKPALAMFLEAMLLHE